MAFIKNWMNTKDFENIRFFIEEICKCMGRPRIIEQETKTILKLLKKYDNK